MNRVTLVGYVGADPEMRAAEGGVPVATFTLATTQQWTGADGQKKEKTQWHKIVAWGTKKSRGLTELVEKYIHKGSPLLVEGRIEYRQWKDKENATRYSTEVVAQEIILLPNPKTHATAAAPSAGEPETESFGDGEDDDDLPF